MSIPTKEPLQLRAGDTWKWKKNLPDYPSSLWTLKYYLVNSSDQIVITAIPDDDNFLIDVDKETTSSYSPGTYSWIAKVSKGQEEYTIDAGTIEILPDLASAASGYDTRSHVKKVLDAIEAAIEGRASRTDLSLTIAGRTIQHMGPDELIRWHSHYKLLYLQEQQKERLSQGLATGNKILMRFK